MREWINADQVTFGVGQDTYIKRTGAAALETNGSLTVDSNLVVSGTISGGISPPATMTSPHGATYVFGMNEEEITLSTQASTTDSSANLLPANSLIDGVSFYTTVSITTAANFTIGDASSAARFIATSTKINAGDSDASTIVGNTGNANAAGPVQASAAKVRITCDQTAGAGKIRVCVFYRQITAPTS